MANNTIKWGANDTPAPAIKWGAADTPADQPAMPAATPAVENAPTPDFSDPSGVGDAGAIMAVAQPKRESVLEGVQMPEPRFDPVEAERLSRRDYAERTPGPGDPRLNAPSMTPGQAPRQPSRGTELGEQLRDASFPVRAAARAYAGAAEGAGGVVRSIGDVTGIEPLSAAGAATASGARDFQQGMGDIQQVEGFGPKSPVPYLTRMAENATSSIGQTAAVAATMGPRAVIPMLSIMTAGQEYDQARQAGLEPSAALAGAIPKGLFEAIGEKYTGLDRAASAMGVLLNKGASDAAKRTAADVLVHAGIREIPGEVITYLGQSGVDKLPGIGLNPNMSMADFINGLRDTVVQAGMMGGAMGGGGIIVRGHTPDIPAEEERVRQLRKAGETGAADVLQKRIDQLNLGPTVLRELSGLKLDAANQPLFQADYTEMRAAGVKPVEATGRAAVLSDFRSAAAAAGLSERAIAAGIEAAKQKNLADLPGFLHRYVQSLAAKGVAQPVDLDAPLTAARDHGIDAATASLLAATPAASPEATQAVDNIESILKPTLQTGNDIAVTPEHDAVHTAATSPLNDTPEPTQAQKEAGNYKVGRIRIAGMDISVENPQGSVRSGTDADGKPWETPMRHHYGYFRGTTAADGDKLDVFVVPGTPEDYRGPVFVVDQVDPKTGRFDEHKVVLGASSEAEAEAIYRSNYSADWQGLGAITRLPLNAFKAWASGGNTKEALGDVQTPQQSPEDRQTAAPLPADQAATAADGTAGLEPGAVQPVGEDAGRAAAEQPAAVAPERSARQVAEDAERARVEEQRARRRAAAKEAAKPMEGLSVGTMPTNAEPVTVKDGVVYVGKYPAQNFDTGADVTVPADATPQQIATALREAGALGKHARIFGLPQETPAVEAAAQRSVDDRKLTAVRNADGKFQAVDDSGKIIPESPEFDTGPEADHWRRTVHNASPAEGRSTDRIEDFGEKIGGARKDVWTSYRDSLDEVSDDEIASQPLSKIWPQPDYQAMLDGGADPWTVGFMRAARDEIPAKPRVSYKVKRWAETVKMLRGFTTQLLDGSIDSAKARAKLAEAGVKSRGLLDIAGRIDLYMAVGHKQSLAGVRITAGEYNLYKGVEYKPAKVFWIVEKEAAATAFSNWPRELAIGDTRAEAIANFKAKYDSLEIQPPASKEVSFDIFVERGKDGFFIGKKIGRNIATLEGPFPDVKAAREYRAKNQDTLLAKLEKVKEIPRERRDTNEPRVGEDMRNGEDATPQMFADAFGFRGVEFGNWVEQGKRQKDLNDAYDALMDMAAILDVPPRALSLNGELGLAFGARGTGGKGAAVAHYERDFVAINLTKKEGAGSLGHEWWHALDNYFSRMRSKPGDMMTEGLDVSLAARGSNFIANTAVRREMVQAFGEVVRAIKNTALKARSAKLDAKRTKEYWTTGPEMSARAFESYLISKLQDQNASNDYLANIVDETTWKAAESMGFELDDSYPYPTAGEIPAIRAGFDHFFQTVQTRETDQGVAMFARAGMDAAAFRRAFGAPEPMGVDRAQKIVGELTSTWENGPKLKVVAKASDLPGGSHPSDARGLILNGTAYIVAANNPTRDAVARTLGHEAIGHYGLWRSLGIDGTRHFQRNLQLAVKSGNKPINAIRDKVRRLYVDDNGRFNLTPEQEANEIAAFAVEDGVDPVTGEFKTGFSWLKQFWAKIAAFLRDTLGLPVRFTNAELQGMLVAAMQGLQAGQRLDGSGDVLVAAARQDQPVALPDVIVANSLGTATSLPDYPAAKAGDIGAAVKVARAVVTDKLVAKVREAIGDSRPVIVPVVSEESTGRNRIPLAAAEVLAAKLGLETETGIVQANRPHRTGMDGLDRIFAVPDFTGAVEAGRDYLLLDDTLTQGATFAALASHIRQAGGRVIAAVALTGKQYSATITPSDKSLQQLREKHGDLETDFRAATGYGFDALTQSEARYLANYEPAQRLRDRIAAEGRRARESGDPQTAGGLSRGAPAPFEPVKTRVGTAYKAGDIALAAPKLNPRQPGNGDSRFDYKIRDRAAFAQAKAQGLSDEQALEASHVGFVTLDVSPSGQFKALRYIMVFESQRGRGIANKVVGSIMATLPADASLQVYDILPAAVDFWAKMGAKFPRSEEFMEAHLTPQQYRSAYAQQQGTGRGTPDQRAGGQPQGDARGAGRGFAADETVARRGPGEGETSAYARGTAETVDGAPPEERQRSAWRDASGHVKFAPGQWLYDALGKAADPLLTRLQLKMASPELRRQLRAMKLDVQKAQDVAVAVAREAQKLSEGDRLMVSDIIEKELASGVVPPEHAVRLAAIMNQAMGEQSKELVRLGMLSPEAAKRWDGAYLPRFYESKLRKQVGDVWADAVARMGLRPKSMKGIRGKHLHGRGMYETIPEDQLANYEAAGWEVRDPDYQPGLPSMDGTVQVWRDYTRAERDAMGEIRDAGFRFVMGYMQTQKDIALGKMFEAMAADPESSSRTPREGWVRVPDVTLEGTGAKRYGRLSGRYVPMETLSHLTQLEEAQSAAWRLYRSAMAVWKEGKTALNPVAHVNNVVSNLTMAHLAGVSYHRWDKYLGAIRDFASGADMLKEARDAGLFLGTISDAELMSTLPPELKALARQADSKVKQGATAVYDAMNYWLRKPMGAAYQAEDTFFRYLIYRDVRQRGVDPQDAIDYAQRFIFTYDDLPKGARMIRDFGMPFFAYTYKAIPAMLHAAMTRPDRFLAPAAVLWAANAAAYAIATGDADDDWWTRLQKYLTDPEYRARAKAQEQLEREHLPPWMKGNTALATPKTIRLGTDELTKLPLFMDVSRMVPGGDMFDVTPNAAGIPLPQPFTPSHPIFTTMTAMLANKDLWTGKDLVDSNDTRAEATEKRMAWLWKQMSPAIAVNNYHWERGMNALAQAVGGDLTWVPDALGGDATGIGRDGNPVQPKYAAMQTFGIKVRPIDIDMAEKIDMSQRKKMISDIDAEMRKLKRLNRMGAVSDRALDRAWERADEKKDRLREGLTVDGDAR